MVKECSICGQEKPHNEYHLDRTKKDGIEHRCKPCKIDYINQRNKNNVNNAVCKKEFPIRFDNGVYAIKEGNEIVYIGSSRRMSYRLSEHFNNTKQSHTSCIFNLSPFERKLKYSWHVLWYGPSDDMRKDQEKSLIQIHQPKLNKLKYKNYAA